MHKNIMILASNTTNHEFKCRNHSMILTEEHCSNPSTLQRPNQRLNVEHKSEAQNKKPTNMSGS